MNILEIVSGTTVNGAIRHCLLLSRALARRGHRVTVACRPESWIAEQLHDDPVDMVYSDLHRWPTDELRRMTDLVHGRHIDVLHTHLSRAHFFGVLLRGACGVPCVATAHSRHFQLHWMFNDLVIAVSEATRLYHQRWNHVSSDRIVTIPNFVDSECVTAAGGPWRANVRSELHIGESDNLLGVIGNVIPRKGTLYLVRAMPRILAGTPGTRLAIIAEGGTTDYVDRVKRAIAELGLQQHVLWLGPHNVVSRLLPALDVCVLPSLEESMPLAILEAMGAGLPVVASAVGGVKECIRHGETGLLVPPADAQSLADATLAILNDPGRRRRFGDAAKHEIERRFAVESVVPQIEAALTEAAARRHNRRLR
jgi:glycosyltransferase involved in cell wall biosynthesis